MYICNKCDLLFTYTPANGRCPKCGFDGIRYGESESGEKKPSSDNTVSDFIEERHQGSDDPFLRFLARPEFPVLIDCPLCGKIARKEKTRYFDMISCDCREDWELLP